jgi:hypothetical protein
MMVACQDCGAVLTVPEENKPYICGRCVAARFQAQRDPASSSRSQQEATPRNPMTTLAQATAFVKQAAFTRAIKCALFWDEDGDWRGAVALGLLRLRSENDYCYERTALGEEVAALVVQQTVLGLARDKDGDRLRAVLFMMPCKYEDTGTKRYARGARNLVHVLIDLDLLHKGDRTLQKHSALVHTWLGHEVVTAMRGGRDPDREQLAMTDRREPDAESARQPDYYVNGKPIYMCGARRGSLYCQLEAGHVEKDGSQHACPSDDLSVVHQWHQWSEPDASKQGPDGQAPGYYWVRWNGGHAPSGPWRVIHTSDAMAQDVELEWGPRVASPGEIDREDAAVPTLDKVWICKNSRYGISVHATYPSASQRSLREPGTSVVSIHAVESEIEDGT